MRDRERARVSIDSRKGGAPARPSPALLFELIGFAFGAAVAVVFVAMMLVGLPIFLIIFFVAGVVSGFRRTWRRQREARRQQLEWNYDRVAENVAVFANEIDPDDSPPTVH